MMRPWPTVDEERGGLAEWRRLSIVMQAVLFLLTTIGVAALYWLCDVLDLPKGWVTLIVSLGAAEILIWRGRFWRTGVEAALWIGGLFAFIFSLPSSGKPEAILVFVAAAAIAGWRVRNALFGVVAFVLGTVYLMAKDWPWSAFAFATLITLIAVFALTRIIQRPSTEALWEVAVIVMPVAAFPAVKSTTSPSLRVIVLYAAFAALFVIVGIRTRSRVLLIATVVAAAIAGIEARNFIPLSDEMRLIVAGTAVLAIATAVMRRLRGREHGFVIGEPKRSELQEIMTVAPAILSVHGGEAAATPQHTGGGGDFGGAGASGDY
jgi:hypothetical protein